MKNTRRVRRFAVGQAVRLVALAVLVLCHVFLIREFSSFSPRVELTGNASPASDRLPQEMHAAVSVKISPASGDAPAVIAVDGDFQRYADIEMTQGAFPEREMEAAVSEKTAKRQYGDISPLGKMLHAAGREYRISGAYREKPLSRLFDLGMNAVYVRSSRAGGKTRIFLTSHGTFARQRTEDALSLSGWKTGNWQIRDLSDRAKLVKQTGTLFIAFAELAASALIVALFVCAVRWRVRSSRLETGSCYLREYFEKHDTELLLRLILWTAAGFLAAWLVQQAMGLQPYMPLNVLETVRENIVNPADPYSALYEKTAFMAWTLFALESILTLWVVVKQMRREWRNGR